MALILTESASIAVNAFQVVWSVLFASWAGGASPKRPARLRRFSVLKASLGKGCF